VEVDREESKRLAAHLAEEIDRILADSDHWRPPRRLSDGSRRQRATGAGLGARSLQEQESRGTHPAEGGRTLRAMPREIDSLMFHPHPRTRHARERPLNDLEPVT